MRNTDLFDDYLNDKLNAGEKASFENTLHTDAIFAKAFAEHKSLIDALKHYSETQELHAQLKQIHEKEFAGDAKIISINKETFAKRYGKTVMVAASTALIAVLSTVAALSTGGVILKKQNDEITDLKKEVYGIKNSQEAIVEGIKQGAENMVKSKAVYAPANFEGSAFALNNNGYIVTSLHMITGADSVFVQNATTERALAKVVMIDAKLDLAVLKIENNDVIKNWQVPFSFTGKVTDVGEKVFTLGYPRKDMVYGEGSLSSLSGYYNDTTMYQISIPVNPGNSGGPLLDEQGNVIGIIRGKINSAEATGFAIKSIAIIKSINTLSADSIQITNKKSLLKGLKRVEQIKRINPYVFNVLVY